MNLRPLDPQSSALPAALHPDAKSRSKTPTFNYGGDRGIRTLDEVSPHTRVPVVRLRPAQPSLRVVTDVILPWFFEKIKPFLEKNKTFFKMRLNHYVLMCSA